MWLLGGLQKNRQVLKNKRLISFLKKTSKDAQIQFSGNILNETENDIANECDTFEVYVFAVIRDAMEQKYEKNVFHILPNTLKPSE